MNRYAKQGNGVLSGKFVFPLQNEGNLINSEIMSITHHVLGIILNKPYLMKLLKYGYKKIVRDFFF